jgi:hypothetical protein
MCLQSLASCGLATSAQNCSLNTRILPNTPIPNVSAAAAALCSPFTLSRLHPSARIDGRHELRCYSTVAPAVGSYQLIFAWSDCESSNMDFDGNMDFGKLLAKLVSL